MKTLILYQTKYGTTLKCAKRIAAKVKNFTLQNIEDNSSIDLIDYSTVYIGFPLYYGRINNKVKRFLKENKQALLQKDLRFFTVGLDDKHLQDTIKRNIDPDLLAIALHEHVGGAYYFEKMSFFERFIVKRVGSFSESTVNIDDDKIEAITQKKKS